MPEHIYVNNAMLNVNIERICHHLVFERSQKNYSRFSINHPFYNSINVRYFSTSATAYHSNINEQNNEVYVYKNVYEGRGVPNPEPFWVKSNGYPISMFGASWGTLHGPTSDLPIADPKIYHHITDPFHNRNKIYELCKGMMVVYIWTYTPKAFCLVGSSSNSVERIFNYFSASH